MKHVDHTLKGGKRLHCLREALRANCCLLSQSWIGLELPAPHHAVTAHAEREARQRLSKVGVGGSHLGVTRPTASAAAAAARAPAAAAAPSPRVGSNDGWGDDSEDLDAPAAATAAPARPAPPAGPGSRRPLGARPVGTRAAGSTSSVGSGSAAAGRKPGGGMKLGAGRLGAAKLQADADFDNW